MSDPLPYESRVGPTRMPGDLKAVAWVFIAFGILAAIDIIRSLVAGRININLGVLGIFIGRGLMRYSRGWRTCALVITWLSLTGIPLIVLIALLAHKPVEINGFPLGIAGAVAVLVFGFALWIWEYRVLTRPGVRWLFGLAEKRP